MKLVILNKISEEKLTEFRNAVPGSVIESYPSPRDALSHVSDADAIAMWGFQNVQPFLEASPHVRWIHSLSDGVERLLTKDMLKRSIILTNSHGIHDHAVADHTLALLLSLVRCLPVMIRQQDQKNLETAENGFLLPKDCCHHRLWQHRKSNRPTDKRFQYKNTCCKKTYI